VPLFEQRHAFSDVDAAGAAEEATAYLAAAAEHLRALRMQSLDALELAEGSYFLDAGCGLGEIVREVASRVGLDGCAAGVDLSVELIRRARGATEAGTSGARFEVADIAQLPFANATFDAIRCERVFQHLDDDVASAAASEFVRVARPGGRIHLLDAVHSTNVVDCDDMGVFDAILEHFTDEVRDPSAGIRLGRRLQTAGATVRSFETIARPLEFASWWHALAIDQRLAALVANSAVSQDRADAFRADLTHRAAIGRFYATAVSCRALAVSPGAAPRDAP
jgi:ubiquinone/menaquinone biosynthesis C-methylase UbiE